MIKNQARVHIVDLDIEEEKKAPRVEMGYCHRKKSHVCAAENQGEFIENDSEQLSESQNDDLGRK